VGLAIASALGRGDNRLHLGHDVLEVTQECQSREELLVVPRTSVRET
jgi:hypothetical protein